MTWFFDDFFGGFDSLDEPNYKKLKQDKIWEDIV